MSKRVITGGSVLYATAIFIWSVTYWAFGGNSWIEMLAILTFLTIIIVAFLTGLWLLFTGLIAR